MSERPESPSDTPASSRSWVWTLGVGFITLLVATWALPSSIQAGDAGEFATVMLEGGVPHPSGYPWMRIFGLLARLLRTVGVSPVRAAASVGMLSGVAGWMVLHRVALWVAAHGPNRQSGGCTPAGVAAIASFPILLCALSSPVVLHVNDSEVWGPLVLFSGVLLWTAWVRGAGPLWVGVAFGVALSHHLTAALLLPVCVGAAWPVPFRWSCLLTRGLRGVVGGVLGLSAYLTLAIGQGSAWRWGDTDSLSGLVHHVSRADYGVLSLSLQNTSAGPLDQLARSAASVGGSLSAGLVPIPAVAGVLVLALIVLALRTSWVPVQVRAGLLAAAVGSVALFPLAHNIDPRNEFGAWILERFDILSLVLMAQVAVVALAKIPVVLRGRRRAGFGAALAGGLLLLRQLLVTAWHGVPADNPDVHRYAIDAVSTPPTGRAIIVGTDDHRLFPITYVQEVEAVRPDVLYIDASLLAHPWYRAHLRRRFPDLPDVDKPVGLMAELWRSPRWSQVPIYLTNDFSRPSRGLPRVPEGLLWRVIPPGKESSPQFEADRVLARHRAALSRYGAPSVEPLVAGHPFAADLRATYTEGTAGLAQALRAQGRPDDAEDLLRFATNPPASR